MQTDPIADFLTILRNASRSAKAEVKVPYSRVKSSIAHILLKQGYLAEVETLTGEKTARPQLRIKMRGSRKTRAITSIRRISTPGLRRYVGADEIPNVLNGMGISIVSTSQGIMAGHEARQRRLGGELLLETY
jgi:small subunit ribosomal protein S8